MTFGRYINLGSAQASVVIDLSQAEASVARMRQIAQQFRQQIDQMNRASTTPAASGAGGSSGNASSIQGLHVNLNAQMQQTAQAALALQRQMQQSVQQAAQQALGQTQQNIRQQTTLIANLLSQARSEVAVQTNRFQTSAATAPSTVQRAPVTEELAKARQPIAQLAAQFAQLRVAITAAGNDQNALASLDTRVNQLLNDAQRLVNGGFKPLEAAVRQFASAAASSRSGLEGYFTAVREGLERLNETSLAANLQEISFRLLPAGIAAGAATKRGIETAQSIEVARVNLQAFTGTEAQADALMNQLVTGARRLGQPMFDVLDVMTQFAPQLRAANIELDDAFNLAARLAAANPREGLSGALYSISEAAAGQFVSLRRRFNIEMSQLQPLIDQKGLVAGLDEYLSKLGRTTELSQSLGATSRASFQRLSDSFSNFLASTMDSYLDGMSNAADVTAQFFDSLASGNSVFSAAVGGLLLFTNALTTGLITLGQFALAFNAIKILIAPVSATGQVGGLVGLAIPIATSIGAAITSALPAPIIAAFTSAAAAITGIIATAVAAGTKAGTITGASQAAGATSGIEALRAAAFGNRGGGLSMGRVAAMTGSVLGGVAIGTNVAAGMGIPGIETAQDALQRLIQILTLPIPGLVVAFETIKSVIQNAGALLGAAFQNIGTGISAAGGLISDVLAHLGATITDTIGNLQIAIGTALQGIASWVEKNFPAVDTGGLGLAGAQMVLSGNESKLSVLDTLLQPIQSYAERTKDQFINLTEMPLFPTKEQQDEAARTAGLRWVEFNNTIAGILGALGIQLPTVDLSGAYGGSAGGAGGVSGGAGADNADLLDQVYSAALQHMIETTRQLEDMALAAARESEDWAIQQSRTYEDFNRQIMQGQEDYLRQQAQSQDDFDRQMADEQENVQEQRKKQEDDFQKQQLRAAEDHLRNMRRLSRDVDDAISARDFLAAQKQLVRMADEEEDYQIERKRRLEDYEGQLEDLKDNLKEQQDKRREDFARQQRLQAENYALQLRRQQENFARQQQREQEDRARRLARQEQDYQISSQRREQDYALQLLQLQNHNSLTRFYWQYGLSSLESDLLAFFARIGAMDAAGLGLPPAIPEGPGGHPFAQGVWNVPYDMTARVHRGEIITPASFADSVRRGEASITGGGMRSSNAMSGDTYYITIPIEAGGIDNIEELVDVVERRIVPKFTHEIERLRQNRRNRTN